MTTPQVRVAPLRALLTIVLAGTLARAAELQLLWDFNTAPNSFNAVVDVRAGLPAYLLDGAARGASGSGRTGAAGDFSMHFGTGAQRLSVNGTDAAYLSQFTSGDTLSLSFWVRLTTVRQATVVNLMSGSTSSDRDINAHAPWSDNTFYFDTGTGANANRISSAALSGTSFGDWHHVALVKQGATKFIYLDGVPIATGAGAGSIAATVTELIIGNSSNLSEAVDGDMDDFALYSGALTPTEVAQLAGGASPLAIAATPSDSDGDGLPDKWERRWAGNLTTFSSASDDNDYDGIPNFQELANNSNPGDTPIIPAFQAYLKPDVAAAAVNNFGISVAVDGDTAVVGADRESTTIGVTGVIRVFYRVGGVWTQQALITASNAGADDFFGTSVAISGDTIVVGAPYEDSAATGVNGNQVDNSAANSGAAYVFARTGTNWSQQAYLKASNTGANDLFGYSVAISGSTIVVGAYGESSAATGVNGNQADNSALNSGAAYVFVRSGTNWSQQAYLKASNANGPSDAVPYGDLFGSSVAIEGDTIVVGAPNEDSAAPGVNGNQADNTAINSGAAYVFTRSGSNWSQRAYLKALFPGGSGSTGLLGDEFGNSVAISGDTIVVGAPFEDSAAAGVNGNQADNSVLNSGAAYVFARSGANWSQQAYLKASNTGRGNQFGYNVAASGNGILVGGYSTSAAYLFQRSSSAWSQQAYIVPRYNSPLFGNSVALSGGTALVGKPDDNSGAYGVNGDQSDHSLVTGDGAAYVFFFPSEVGDLVVTAPGQSLVSGRSALAYGGIALGSSQSRVLTLRNQGLSPVHISAITTSGANATDFVLNTVGTATTLAAGASTTFTLTFVSQGSTSGPRSATIGITTDSPANNPYTFTLTGRALAFVEDTDGDGLSDAAESNLAALGFDWEVAQPSLVAALTNHAAGAGLYTAAQVQALNVGPPLLQRNPTTGKFTLTIGVQKSTNLQAGSFTPFPMTGPGILTTINGSGQLEFEFPTSDNAAFFRIESH